MSWFSGALGTAGFFGDLAGTIGNIVAQQQMVRNQAKQLEIYQQAVNKSLDLQQRAQDVSVYLSTQAPVLQYGSARALGLTHQEAQKVVSGHRILVGGVDVEPRQLPTLPFFIQPTGHQGAGHATSARFLTGTPGATEPAPPGFSNPNYGVKLTSYRQQLDHSVGESNA
ncbi:small basic protein [Sapovirus Po/OH-JJ681/2000/US]|uniref:Small basic protein n=1 Tax=Sapovirus Po/OH-JJ681/2000/US TaxID=328326 RepID=Q2TCG8_9CALI|nr:small basic protein [Sapovirus Po/OH-JJ681/2000/US]